MQDWRIFHLVHASCKGGEGSLSLNNIFDYNIGRQNPSSIIKTSNFDIKILGEHRLIKTLEHLILRSIDINLDNPFN